MIRLGVHQIARFTAIGLLLVWFLFVTDGASPIVIWPCLLIFYATALRAFRQLRSAPEIRTWITIPALFYLYMYLLFFYPYQLYVLGIYDLKGNAFVADNFLEKTNASIILSTIGILSFEFGYLLFRLQKLKRRSFVNPFLPSVIAVMSMTLLFTIYVATSLKSALAGAYGGSTTGDATTDGIFFLLIYMSMLCSSFFIYYLSLRKKVPFHIWMGMALTGVWSILLLVLGDRNDFFLIAMVLVAGYSSFVRNIKITVLVIAGLCAFFVYNTIEVARTLQDRSISAIVQTAFTPASDSKNIEQGSFGITTITSRAALHSVPEQHDYFLGKFKLIGFAGLVPYSRSLFVDPGDKFTTSSKVLTSTMLRPYASWGVGSNVISDAYMDFGVFGVVIFLGILGAFGRYVQDKATLTFPSPEWISVYLITLACLFEIPRYSVDFLVRPVGWTMMLFALISILKKISKVR